MNERRIKELKIQASKWASENATSTEYENMADQKFAELIIQEAITPNFRSDFSDIKSKFAEFFKKHFGVEE